MFSRCFFALALAIAIGVMSPQAANAQPSTVTSSSPAQVSVPDAGTILLGGFFGFPDLIWPSLPSDPGGMLASGFLHHLEEHIEKELDGNRWQNPADGNFSIIIVVTIYVEGQGWLVEMTHQPGSQSMMPGADFNEEFGILRIAVPLTWIGG